MALIARRSWVTANESLPSDYQIRIWAALLPAWEVSDADLSAGILDLNETHVTMTLWLSSGNELAYLISEIFAWYTIW